MISNSAWAARALSVERGAWSVFESAVPPLPPTVDLTVATAEVLMAQQDPSNVLTELTVCFSLQRR